MTRTCKICGVTKAHIKGEKLVHLQAPTWQYWDEFGYAWFGRQCGPCRKKSKNAARSGLSSTVGSKVKRSPGGRLKEETIFS